MIPPSIFKSYDIRGIYPEEFNEENIVAITRAIVTFLTNNHSHEEPFRMVVGRDMRLSSPSLHQRAVQTLLDLGVDVIDAGLVSTPSFYFTVFHWGYEGGFQISASHNPKEYNGMKIVKNSPRGLIKIGKTTGMEEIKRMSIEGIEGVSRENGVIKTQEDILETEVDHALMITGHPTIKPFRVIADAANAMGATYLDACFNKIPGELIRMNFDLDGTFPAHQPDPLQKETLVDLQKRVREEKADLGLAPDGDGDRLFFIDEQGSIIPPSIITALVAKELLATHRGEKILFDIRYILTPQTIIKENGGEPVITKVGHAFITEKLHETGGLFAGESSGHYFFRETGNAESQIPVLLTVLAVMTREGKPLSQIIQALKRSEESGEINFKVTNAPEILNRLAEQYGDGDISNLDGIAVSYSNWRFSVRTSNTEPLLRLNLETRDQGTLARERDKLVEFIRGAATTI